MTEPWDIGMAPQPAGLTTRRYMVLRKATSATEAGAAPPPAAHGAARLIDETTRGVRHVVTETMRPSRRGRRYRNSRDGVSVFDGPFIETKELIAGYVVVSAASLDDAGALGGAVPRRRRGRRGGSCASWSEPATPLSRIPTRRTRQEHVDGPRNLS